MAVEVHSVALQDFELWITCPTALYLTIQDKCELELQARDCSGDEWKQMREIESNWNAKKDALKVRDRHYHTSCLQ